MKTLTSTVDQARLLAVTSPQSGDWLHALLLSECGLRLDGKAIHIAVGLRLGPIYVSPTSAPEEHPSMPRGYTASPARVALVDLLGLKPRTTYCGVHCPRQTFQP